MWCRKVGGVEVLDPGTHLKPGAPPALLTAPHDSQVEQSEISGESAEGGGREGHGWRGVVWCDAALCGAVRRGVARGTAWRGEVRDSHAVLRFPQDRRTDIAVASTDIADIAVQL